MEEIYQYMLAQKINNYEEINGMNPTLLAQTGAGAAVEAESQFKFGDDGLITRTSFMSTDMKELGLAIGVAMPGQSWHSLWDKDVEDGVKVPYDDKDLYHFMLTISNQIVGLSTKIDATDALIAKVNQKIDDNKDAYEDKF